jgi:hypothetical protein
MLDYSLTVHVLILEPVRASKLGALLPDFSQCMIVTQALHVIFQHQLSTF